MVSAYEEIHKVLRVQKREKSFLPAAGWLGVRRQRKR